MNNKQKNVFQFMSYTNSYSFVFFRQGTNSVTPDNEESKIGTNMRYVKETRVSSLSLINIVVF